MNFGRQHMEFFRETAAIYPAPRDPEPPRTTHSAFHRGAGGALSGRGSGLSDICRKRAGHQPLDDAVPSRANIGFIAGFRTLDQI